MAAQDVRELIPRVRRAMEGPVPPAVPLSDEAVLAATADALSDIILLTVGEWGHVLAITHRDTASGAADEWSIDPALTPEEESVVAAQAAISYFFHAFKDIKVSEKIENEGASWEWAKSANLFRDQIKMLQDQRDRALAALQSSHPALARYASILEVRDRLGAAEIGLYP
jgi:hypothetical protein